MANFSSVEEHDPIYQSGSKIELVRTTIETDFPVGLSKGMTRTEVVTVLGEPDNTGGTSRKYRTPCIYVYGDIELTFESWKEGKLVQARKKSLAPVAQLDSADFS